MSHRRIYPVLISGTTLLLVYGGVACSFDQSCFLFSFSNSIFFSILQPLQLFLLPVSIVAFFSFFLPGEVFKTWRIFSAFSLPLLLFFIIVIPTGSGAYFNLFPYFRADAARDAGIAFVLLSLVVVLLKFYQLRKIRLKKLFEE